MNKEAQWISRDKKEEPVPPAHVLLNNIHLLSDSGRALDIACGLAENSFLLAQHGYLVDAWDNSTTVVKRVNKKALKTGLPVRAMVTDVNKKTFPLNYYDVVIMTHYLEKRISANIIGSLKPGGLLFFQTYTRECVNSVGPQEPIYRLKPNELLSMFSSLHLVVYREEGKLGNVTRGFRNEALLVARKI